MKMYKQDTMYEGFSLVEMLITITILGFVMVLTATTLTTLIKVSTVSDLKTTSRNDVNFVLEFSKRALSNSNLEDIYIYDSSAERTYSRSSGNFTDGLNIANVYSTPLDLGNEVHVRVYGYDRWACIGYFKDTNDPTIGYVLKTSVDELTDHSTCFGDADYPIIMSSEVVNITAFDIQKSLLNSGNTMFVVDMEAEPTYWPVGSGMPITKSVAKQITVMTQGLTWY